MTVMKPPKLPITPVPHNELRPELFPRRGASLDEIVALGYTFDGYAHLGMEACAALANDSLNHYYATGELKIEELDELRSCLFFEARRWSLYAQHPDTKATIYIFALIDALKEKVPGSGSKENADSTMGNA